MREIAVINTNRNVDVYSNVVNALADNGHITVFVPDCEKPVDDTRIAYVKMPSDIALSGSKISNFVYTHYFNTGFKGFLHVIDDKVCIYNPPSRFMDEIEKMMTMLRLKSWYNTVCDVCNYTFMQYNPKFSVELDSVDVKDRYAKTIYFTTHANPSWSCFNYGISSFDDIRLDDRFSIPMYYIIEFLARRRNNKRENELYFMNCYPTIMEERNVFGLVDGYVEPPINQELYLKEGNLFNSLNIQHKADTAVEPVMDSIHHLLTH